MKLYNSLNNQKEEFVPIKPGEVTIYSCGPTVYNLFHIGNARPFIIFDTLRNYLVYRGYKVTFVQNLTDIDDKMINKAASEGITVKQLADRYIEEYFVDAKGLKIKRADVHPRATECIKEIVDMIVKLVDKGFAYEKNGDVYFKTKSFSEYGKLSHQPLEDLEAGARISINEHKDDAMDFALWKAAKPGEPKWESPWGEGRPGWHIECSVMANKYLGETIDIHCGGKDLIFPHHENEIAQSECASGKPFAHYWLHNGFINVDNNKMSKSLGNFFMVRDAAAAYSYEIIRFFMLSAHYRSPINYSDTILNQSKAGLERLYNSLTDLDFKLSGNDFAETSDMPDSNKFKKAFTDAMDDDINTADALGVIFELVREINTAVKENRSKAAFESYKSVLLELCGVLGLLQNQVECLDSEIEDLIAKRQAARKDKNYKLSDEIRDKLKGMGIVLEDTPSGVKWKRIQ